MRLPLCRPAAAAHLQRHDSTVGGTTACRPCRSLLDGRRRGGEGCTPAFGWPRCVSGQPPPCSWLAYPGGVCARPTCALTYGDTGDAGDSGVMNAPLESIARDLGFEGDTVLKGAVVTVMIVGGVIGGVVIGPTSDSIGRRTALGVTCVPLMVGPVISGLSGSLEPMIIGRFLTGIGIGASSALVPLYLSEVRPKVGARRQNNWTFMLVGALL